MIYLFAILWFASGFFGAVYLITVVDGQDFQFPSEDFALAILFGILAPFVWVSIVADLLKRSPKITLFKARNK